MSSAGFALAFLRQTLLDELVIIPGSGVLSLNFGLLPLMRQCSYPGLEQPADKHYPRMTLKSPNAGSGN